MREQFQKYETLFPMLGKFIDLPDSLAAIIQEFRETGLPEIYEHVYRHPPDEKDLAEWRSRAIELLQVDFIDWLYGVAETYLEGYLRNPHGIPKVVGGVVKYKWSYDPHIDTIELRRMWDDLMRLRGEYDQFQAKRAIQPPLF